MVVSLDSLEIGRTAVITGLDIASLGEVSARRLRAIGIDKGVAVETLHQGVLLSRDPIAVRVGRMTVAIRAAQAAAIEVELR